MSQIFRGLAAFLIVCSSMTAVAFTEGDFYVGLGYFSENSLGRITQSASGKKTTSLFGTISYPLLLKYDWRMGQDYFLAPTLTYTLFNRKAASNSAEINEWHLMFPIGKNFDSSAFDWYVGPGILNRTIKGSGGIVELNNGGSTAAFALPSRTVTTRVITMVTGASYRVDSSRFAFEIITEGLMSKKRTFDLMLSYAYSFGRGF